MIKAHFSRFFAANPGRLHFAAHSHHPWPDATQAAHARYWTDSATARRPQVGARPRRSGARGAGPRRAPARACREPRQVAFAPNTHEFVSRLYSCLDPGAAAAGAHERARVPQLSPPDAAPRGGRARAGRRRFALQPWETFAQRFARRRAIRATWDLVWISHVLLRLRLRRAGPRGDLRGGAARGPGGDRRLPRVLRAARRSLRACTGAPSTSRAATSTRCPAKARASSRSRRVASCGPSIPGGMRRSTRSSAPPGGAVALCRGRASGSGAPRSTRPASIDSTPRWTGLRADGHRPSRRCTPTRWRCRSASSTGWRAAAPAPLLPERLVAALEAPRGNFLAFDVDDASELHRRIAAQSVTIDRRDAACASASGSITTTSDVDRLLVVLARALR